MPLLTPRELAGHVEFSPDERNLTDRLTRIERIAGHRLPSEVTLALAQADGPNEWLDQAARLLARTNTISPASIFVPRQGTTGPLTHGDFLVNPVTGDFISYDRAVRALGVHSEDYWRSMLSALARAEETQQLAAPGTPGRRAPRSTTLPGARSVVASLVALSNTDREALAAPEAYNIALQAASEKLNPELLAANVRWTEEQLRGTPVKERLLVAMNATRSQVTLTSTSQALYLLADEDTRAQMRDELRGIVMREQASGAEISQPEATEDPLAAIGRLQPMAAGLALSPEFQQILTTEGELTDEQLFDQRLTELLNDARGVGFSENIEDAQHDPDGFWLGKGLAFAMEGVGWTFERAGKYVGSPILNGLNAGTVAIYQGIRGMSPGLAAELDQTSADSWNELRLAWHGETYAGQLMTDDLRLPSWTAPINELLIGSILAPDAIATSVLRSARQAKAVAMADPFTFRNGVVKVLTEGDWRIGGRTLPEWLVDAAAAGDIESFRRKIGWRLRTTFGSQALDQRFTWSVYEAVQADRAAGVAVENTVRHVQETMARAYGLRVDPASIPGMIAARVEVQAAERAAINDAVIAALDAEDAKLAAEPVQLFPGTPPGVEERAYLATKVPADDPVVAQAMNAAIDSGYVVDDTLPRLSSTRGVVAGDTVRIADEGRTIEGRVVQVTDIRDGAQTLVLADGTRVRTSDAMIDVLADGVRTPANAELNIVGTPSDVAGVRSLAERRNVIAETLDEGGEIRFVSYTDAGARVTSPPLKVTPGPKPGTWFVVRQGRKTPDEMTLDQVIDEIGVPTRPTEEVVELAISPTAYRGIGETNFPQDFPEIWSVIRDAPEVKAGRGTTRKVRLTRSQAAELRADMEASAGASAAAAGSDFGESGGWQRAVLRRIEGAKVVRSSVDGEPPLDLTAIDEALAGLSSSKLRMEAAAGTLRADLVRGLTLDPAALADPDIARAYNQLVADVEATARSMRTPLDIADAGGKPLRVGDLVEIPPVQRTTQGRLGTVRVLPGEVSSGRIRSVISTPDGAFVDVSTGAGGVVRKRAAETTLLEKGRTRAAVLEDIRADEALRRAAAYEGDLTGRMIAQRQLRRATLRAIDQADLEDLRRATEQLRTPDPSTLALADYEAYLVDHFQTMLELPRISLPFGTSAAGAALSRLGGELGSAKAIRALRGSLRGGGRGRIALQLENRTQTIADEYVRMVRSRVFTRAEIAEYEKRLSEAYLQVGWDHAVQNTIRAQDKLMIERIGAIQGWSPEQLDELLKVQGLRQPKRVYGLMMSDLPAGEMDRLRAAGAQHPGVAILGGDPKFTGQLVNSLQVWDPAYVRRAMNEITGATKALRNAIVRPVRNYAGDVRGVPAFKAGPLARRGLQADKGAFTIPAIARGSYDLFIRAMFLSWWKPAMVLRPAYVVRVVAGEEMLRSVSTIGVVGRMEAGRHVSRALTWAGRAIGRTPTMELRYFDTTADEWRVLSLPRNAGARVALDDGYAYIDDEALIRANTQSLFGAGGRASTSWRKALTDDYGPIQKGATQYWDAYVSDLQNQIGRSPEGGRILYGIESEASNTAIADDLFEWYMTDEGEVVLRRLLPEWKPGNWSDERIIELIDTQIGIARYYTDSHPELARMAREGTLDPRTLANSAEFKGRVPEWVHGPEIGTNFGGEGALRRGVDKVASAILEMPTDRLSRQPFFRAWYQRALAGQHALAEAQGITVTDTLLSSMQAEARRFAIDQVNRVMFDFARTNRLTELASFVIPFAQPFGEAFISWSRIVRQNPHLLSVYPRIYQAASRMGTITQDPETGEDVFDAGWMARGILAGQLNSALPIPSGIGYSAPLSGLNMLVQSTIPIGTDSGEIAIPFPSFSPPLQFVLQRWFESDDNPLPPHLRIRYAPWIIGFGRIDSPVDFLPAWMRNFVTAKIAGPDNDLLQSNADKFAEILWLQGYAPIEVTTDENGNEVTGPRQDPPPGFSASEYAAMTGEDKVRVWTDYVSRTSLAAARELYERRTVWSLFLPVSPRLNWPQQGYNDELQQLRLPVDQGGLGYAEGTAEFLRRHGDEPGVRLLTIAESMWNPQVTGANPYEQSPIALPANRYVDEFLRDPYVKEFANDYPEWVWAIIPSELRSVEDPEAINSYYSQLDAGLREVRSPSTLQGDAIVQAGWDAYFAAREEWKRWQDTVGRTVSQESITWEQAKARILDDRITELGEWNTAWRKAYNTFERAEVDPNALAHARAIAANDTLATRIDAIAGLREYLALFDETDAKMTDERFTSLDQVAATALRTEYEAEVAAIIERHPDFAPAMDLFFEGAFMGRPSLREIRYGEASQGVLDQITEYEQERQDISAAIERAVTPAESSAAYDALRALEDGAYSTFEDRFNPVLVNYEDMTDVERDEFRLSMLDQPYAFMSRFRRTEVLGETYTGETDAVWRSYLAAYGDIQRQAGTGADVGPMYDGLEATMAAFAAKDPVLAEQLRNANDWTFKASHLIREAADPKAPSYGWWQQVLDDVASAQAAVTMLELHGRESEYAQLKNLLTSQIQTYMEASEDFERSWYRVEEALGSDRLIDALMPESYYPIGGAAFVRTSREPVADPVAPAAGTAGGYLYSEDELRDVWGI